MKLKEEEEEEEMRQQSFLHSPHSRVPGETPEERPSDSTTEREIGDSTRTARSPRLTERVAAKKSCQSSSPGYYPSSVSLSLSSPSPFSLSPPSLSSSCPEFSPCQQWICESGLQDSRSTFFSTFANASPSLPALPFYMIYIRNK